MRKRIFMVRLKEGAEAQLEGAMGNGLYVFDCYAHIACGGQHQFMHAFHTDAVESVLVEECRELTREEAQKL